jgi:predicted dehydrogenase
MSPLQQQPIYLSTRLDASCETFLARIFAQRQDVEIAYACDVDEKQLPIAVKTVQDLKGKAPKAVGSFEHILEDSEMDALVCATPEHWHSPATVLTCQVGKDVYVEAPASDDIWEGRKMVEAARKYKRVVQVGMQEICSSHWRKALL